MYWSEAIRLINPSSQTRYRSPTSHAKNPSEYEEI